MRGKQSNSIIHILALLVTSLLFSQSVNGAPLITSVVETGGDNEATDTITAKWTGQTFPVTVANEPVPGLTIGANYTVGTFGNHAPNFVDRNHRYTNADPVAMPAYLVGQEYIMSGNDNRDNAGYILDITLSAPATVYLLIDNRMGPVTEPTANPDNPPTFGAGAMQWVLDQGWVPSSTGANRTGNLSLPDEVGIDEGADGTINQYYSVYMKSFAPGTIQLFQADNAGRNMYGVVVGALRQILNTPLLIPPANSVWAYNDATVSPGLTGLWTTGDYDTNSEPGWKNGPALFGNDSAGIYDTPTQPFAGLGTGGFLTPWDRTGGRVTFYSRIKFNWTGPTVGVTLIASNWVDDGLLAYLNGVQVSSIRMPAPPITWDTLGANPTEGLVEVVGWDGASLVEGENTIAVEVHQSSTGSSDVAFALSLHGVYPLAPLITNPTQPTNRVVFATAPTTLIVEAIGSPTPTYQWYLNGTAIDPAVNPTATNAAYVIASMQQTDAGDYYCKVSNAVGFADSRTATVVYNNDTTAPFPVMAAGSATGLKISVTYDAAVETMTGSDFFNYSVDGGLVVSSVNLSSDGIHAILNLASPMAADTLYTVTIQNVTDLSGNVISATSNSISFRSWVPSACAGALFETYNTGAGNAVANLTSHPTYPNSPDFRAVINAVDIRVAMDPANPTFYNTDAREAYGGRISGWYIPSESGPHIFFFASDDGGELWLSTDERPSQRVRIAQETVWSNTKQWTTSGGASSLAAKRSAPITLVAGRAYYFEALYKEGGGGDNAAVAVQLPSQTAPPTDGAGAIDATFLGSAAPAGLFGAVTISQQPTDQSVSQNTTATFTVGVNAPTIEGRSVPVCYQWKRDGVDIPGATFPSHSFTAALADSGAKFSVAIAGIGSSATSTEATLTVTVDTQGPLVLAALSSLDGTNVIVRFNERLEATSAEDEFLYMMTGFTINSAVLQPNGTDVLLGISPAMAQGSSAQLSISGVNDVIPNPMVATQMVVRAHVTTFGYARFDLYQGLTTTGIALSELLMAPAYPGAPNITRFRDILSLNNADEFDGYGTRLTGFLIPPVSGNYVFYMHSDDNGQFSLSTNADPANLVILCNEPVWANRGEWTGAGGGGGRGVPSASGGPQANISGPIALVAGQMYAFEALMKEGGGGDNLGINWQPPGAAVPANATPSAIPSSALACLVDPVSQAAFVQGPRITATPSGPGKFILTWPDPSYSLQIATAVEGPWGPYPGGAVSGVEITVATTGNAFVRLIRQ